jgi:hypothetical protein
MPTTKLTTYLAALMLILGLAAAPVALAHKSHHTHHRRHHRHHRRRHHRHHRRTKKHAKIASRFPIPSWTLGTDGSSSAGVTSFTPAPITGTTYYVSPSGSDTNSGTSPSQAWKTVHRVDATTFRPGDGILFQGGATFNDDVLMPGWGAPMSGTSSQPIVFGSYGSGQATLPQGTWLNGNTNLVFENLWMGPEQGVTGRASNITVEGCTLGGMVPGATNDTEIAINAIGNNWIIRDNRIDRTGDSGLLLRGDHFDVEHNSITNTGLDPKITYGDHGIYLKSTNSSVIDNVITHFNNDGVSVRYRNSVVSGNQISGGEIGIAWFQYDPISGTSHWSGNTIASTSIVAIYVSPTDPAAGNTRESFVITGNHIDKPSPMNRWIPMDLQPTTGNYQVSNNPVS